MTIELITGTPGAGKTAFTVGRRLLEESGRLVTVEREGGGTDQVERRIIVAGINGLAMPHDRLPHTLTGERVTAAQIAEWNRTDEDGEPLRKRLPGEPAQDVEASLFNWWLWCKPGDLIVVDEVQFIIPRGTLGKTPPHYIKSLEIHRHYGVDFIFITQSPTLLDTTIRNLVGLHRHVRNLAGPLCLLYEWDHASNTERITNSAKRFIRRRSAWFKLYRSTVAVVKPPSSGKAGAMMIPAFLVVAAGAAYAVSTRFTDPHKISSPVSAVVGSAAPVVPGGAAPAPARPRGFKDVPKLAGCYTHGSSCKCFEAATWRPISIEPGMCKTSASSYDGLVPWAPRDPLPVGSYGAAASAPSAPPSPVSHVLPSI